MILRFIPTFLGVKNLMVTFISPKKLYFSTLIGVAPDFLEEFFQVTNQEILGGIKYDKIHLQNPSIRNHQIHNF